MEQMEHTIYQIVTTKNTWNTLEQNGTKCPFLKGCGTNGTVLAHLGTLMLLSISVFHLFHLFHAKYTPYGEKK